MYKNFVTCKIAKKKKKKLKFCRKVPEKAECSTKITFAKLSSKK